MDNLWESGTATFPVGAGLLPYSSESQAGAQTGHQSRRTQMAESYSGDAYCVKCKQKREFTGEVHETNGRRMAKGICPVCGTKLNRILGKA